MTLELQPTPIGDFPRVDWPTQATRAARPIPAELREACLAPDAAAAQLDRLSAPGALCVTTGQQPGLVLGPLYTVYKALTAVALAGRLEALLGRPVVPVFWTAGDDHDFAEANHLHLLTVTNEVRQLELRARPPEAPLTPLYREPVGPSIDGVLRQLREHTPATEFRDEVFAWIGQHYVPGADLAGAFAGALSQLLAPTGLVVLRPTHAAVKRVMRPWLLQALERAGELDRALAARAGALRAAGATTPVPVGDGATLVMLESDAGRDRLVMDDGAFHARRSGHRYTLAELAQLAQQAPERFSPNVLLRPVVEAAVLPTLAYVAGPGELAYLPQCAPAYEALRVAPQVPVPRWSGLVVEARVRKVLDKYAVAPADLQLPDGQLEQRLVREDMPPSAQAALTALQTALETEYGRLRDAAVGVDPTLRKPVEAALRTALGAHRDVEKKLVHHLKQQNEILVQQLAKARMNLFPLGSPQERVLNPVPYLVRYGPTFLTDVRAAVERWAAGLVADPGAP
ncbi:MAG: bacillithiol biosynthesis cysteine-adding enzyme BshC [Gemmatimonadota bacterium]|nr:bacillithiol biosynthesis cysteine-adding enzyme BshC [Gemmatimonadota bacterium]